MSDHPAPPMAILPTFATDALLAMAHQITQRPPDVEIGASENPYLRRWHVTPRGDEAAVYLHQFCRSDDDRALHDHPWASMSIILRGSYLEHLEGGIVAMRTTGMVVERGAASAHRVELLRDRDGREEPCWTLFLTGRRIREWGFHCPQGWVHWQQFTAGPNGELVGKGCDQ